jgi:hypothetical protein
MARKKEDNEPDYMKVAEELRASLIKEKVKKVDVRQAFHKYFIKVKNKANLKPEMEGVLWKHLKATGNDTPDKFDAGLAHFGILK